MSQTAATPETLDAPLAPEAAPAIAASGRSARMGAFALAGTILIVGGYLVFSGSPGFAGGVPAGALTGMVEGTEVDLAFKMGGSIARVAVEEGDTVQAGQEVASLSSEELLAKRDQARAAAALAAVKIAQAERGVGLTAENNDAQLRQASAAEAAAAAQLDAALNGARPEEVSQLRAKLAAAETNEGAQRRYLESMRALASDGAIPRLKLDEAQAQYDRASAELASTRDQLKMARMGARPEQLRASRAQLNQAAGAVAQARAAQKQVGLRTLDVQAAKASLAQAEGALAEAEAYVRNTHLHAPRAGIVKSVAVHGGELVAQGYTVLTLEDPKDRFVKFYVPENQVAGLTVGQRQDIYVPALQHAVKGHVKAIAPAADFATKKATRNLADRDIRAFQVKLALDDAAVLPGFSVEWAPRGH